MKHLRVLFVVAVTIAAASPAARAEPAPVTIGVLTDMSGTSMDLSGPGSVLATTMAVEDFGGTVLGRPIHVISGDHQLKADIGAAIARSWYDTEGVDLILDVPVSAVGLAVQQVSRDKKRLMITTGTGTSDFTGKFCSPYAMQWNFNTTALANSTARALVERGDKRWFFLTADYAFGAALEHDAARVVTAMGGTVLGDVKHPFNSTDLSSFVLQALGSGADVIGLANGPPDNTNAIKAAAEFGGGKGPAMAGLLVVITDVHGLGLQVAQGLLLTEAFYWDLDDKSRAWSHRFYERANKMPTSVQAADYSATLHYLQAVKEAGTTDAATVAQKMRDAPVEDMFARHGVLRRDGLLVHDLFLFQVKSPAECKAPWDYYRLLSTVPGEQAYPRLEDEHCPLVSP